MTSLSLDHLELLEGRKGHPFPCDYSAHAQKHFLFLGLELLCSLPNMEPSGGSCVVPSSVAEHPSGSGVYATPAPHEFPLWPAQCPSCEMITESPDSGVLPAAPSTVSRSLEACPEQPSGCIRVATPQVGWSFLPGEICLIPVSGGVAGSSRPFL